MQVTIRYSDVSKPINMNCKCAVIMEHIRKLGNYESGLLLDLCDRDGNVKLLRQNPVAYTTTCLTAGDTYYLVSAIAKGKQYTYQVLATMLQNEQEIEVKPTKAEKPVIPRRSSVTSTPKRQKSQ
jgi:hypothetical protein